MTLFIWTISYSSLRLVLELWPTDAVLASTTSIITFGMAFSTGNIYARYHLPLGCNGTRLVFLLPGEDNEMIKCNLHTIDLDHAGSYEALSYVCGD